MEKTENLVQRSAVVDWQLFPAVIQSHSRFPCDSGTCSGGHHHPTDARNAG